MLHIFFTQSGLQYFFAKQIIVQKNIQNPVFITCFYGEQSVLDAIKKAPPEQFFDITWTLGVKPWRAHKNALEKAIDEIACALLKTDRSGVRFYKGRYRSVDLKMIRRAFKNQNLSFNLIPEGADLFRDLPIVRSNKKYLRFLWQKIRFKLKNPAVSLRHSSSSYSRFVDKIYHFPVADDVPIYAPREKIEWIEIAPPKIENQTDKILLIGGEYPSPHTLDWIEKNFVEKEIIYRPHPRLVRLNDAHQNKNPNFEILGDLDMPLEEYILQKNFAQIFGSFSTALIIAHLFCPDTKTVFLYDEKIWKDKTWLPVAEALGLKIITV